MATIWEWIKNLKLRHKLALIYTVAFTIMLGVTFISIYSISANYREEEFYRRLSDRTASTFKLVVQVEQIDNRLLRIFDKNTINNLSQETILLFDSSGRVIYSSVDDTTNLELVKPILARLKGQENVYETHRGRHETVGIRFNDDNATYYGIGTAYDKYGYSKLHFLLLLLVSTYVIVTVLIALLSIYLSGIITRPVSQLTREIEKITPQALSERVKISFTNDEIGFLARKFNELLDKVANAFKFQTHYIHHLSHELKTPLAIMMANAERALTENSQERLSTSMQFQKNAIMDLSNIVNSMLDISKTENKLSSADAESIRIDELIFECLDEMMFLNSNIGFDFNVDPTLDETRLLVSGNSRMLKMAILNLVKNAVNYSVNEKPEIDISGTADMVQIKLINDGPVLGLEEQEKMFLHLFRGKNSQNINGFGLGLVLANRIVALHKGSLKYSITDDNRNCFTLILKIAS